MQDLYEQARVALSAYLNRSLSILGAMEQGRMNSVDRLLRRKTAAFHNFRAIEAMLQKSGIDIGNDATFQALWQEIARVDRELEAAMLDLREELYEELVRSRKVRTNISKYRSGIQLRSAFERSV